MPSTWVDTFGRPKRYPRLDKDISADVAIVGGGIAGTTAAYLLAKAGAKVVLVDKGTIAGSATAYTTAFVSYIADSHLGELKELFGPEAARQVWESGREALQLIDSNVKAESIDCEYVRCDLHKFANNTEEWQELEADADLAAEYGFDVRKRSLNDIQARNFGCFTVKDQAKFHPLKYVQGLRDAAGAAGAFIFERTEAKEILEPGPAVVRTAHGSVTAKNVFVATYQPFNNPWQLFAHKGTYITYVQEMKVPKGVLAEAMYEDGANPYHYIRVDHGQGDYDRVILGGEDHRQELPFDPRKAYAALGRYFRDVFPGVGREVVREWNGPIIETIDGLPYIGAYDDKNPNLFLATGFSGSGMTFGTLAGHMFSEFAQGREVPWKDLYDPLRKATLGQILQKGRDYLQELMNAYVKNVFKGRN